MAFAIGATVPWPLPPDWSDPVRETLAFRTDVLRPANGAEPQRRKLRLAPRRSFAFSALAQRAERRLLDAVRRDRGGGLWALPIWADLQQVGPVAAGAASIACATTGYDFADGGQALLWRGLNEWEVVDVASVGVASLTLASVTGQAWPAGTRLYPLRAARLTGSAEETAKSDQVARLQLNFELAEACDWPAVEPTATYRAKPVLEWRGDEGTDPKSGYTRLVNVVDVETGIPDWRDMAGTGFRLQDQHWLVHGRAEQASLRSLLYWLAGRYSALWIPSGMVDLQLAADIGAADTVLSVDWCGYTVFGRQLANRRDIRIELNDGAVHYRRITDSAEAGNTETLTIDSALGSAIARGQVRSISFMALCLQAADEIEITHLTDADGTARASTRFEAFDHDL